MPAAVSVFVPVFNEAGNVEDAVANVLAAARPLPDHEIIVVNDGSTDGTADVAERLAATIPTVRVIHHPINLGLAAGYRSALAAARMPYFAMISGDAEDTPDSVVRLLAAVGSADLVVPYVADPWTRGWHRVLITATYSRFLNVLFGLRIQHYSGQSIYPTDLARRLQTTTEGSFFLAEMLVRALCQGHSYVAVPIAHQPRKYGRSQAFRVRNILRALATVFRLWWTVRPLSRRRPAADRKGNTVETRG